MAISRETLQKAIAERLASLPLEYHAVVKEIAGLAFQAGTDEYQRLVKQAQDALKENFHGVQSKRR